MVASSDKEHSSNLIASENGSLLKVSAIYGANASGKSNLFKAMKVMERLVLSSATSMNLGDRIDYIAPFKLDLGLVEAPSRFTISLIINEILYIYGFAATRDRVWEEWLDVRRLGGRMSRWFKRDYDPSLKKTKWLFAGPLKKESDLLQSKTRDNGLVLSRGAELNIEPLANLFLWFRHGCNLLDMSRDPSFLAQATARRIMTNESLRSAIVRLIRDADFGISGIHVVEQPADQLPEGAPPELRAFVESMRTIMKKSSVDERIMQMNVLTEHLIPGTDELIQFSLAQEESMGTQRFFALAGPILESLTNGAVLVVDELDCSMHPNLTRKLIQLFQSPLNDKGAQAVFTTHDNSVMDLELFRRDQIWLVDKTKNGASDLYSLHDIEQRPRLREAVSKRYLSGRFGGIPRFGPSLEDVEP